MLANKCKWRNVHITPTQADFIFAHSRIFAYLPTVKLMRLLRAFALYTPELLDFNDR